MRASVYQYSLLGGFGDFVGLDQYQAIFADPYFRNSLWVTLKFTFWKVLLQVVLSLLLALYLTRQNLAVSLVRSAIFTPVVTSIIVVSVLWGMMYHSQLGLINSLLSIFKIPPQAFLSRADRALPALIAMMVWKDVGFSMIILMAGLKGIPAVYREAAVVDGARPREVLWYITLPLLRRILMFVVVTQTIFSFQVFVPVYAMTRGGPMESTKAVVYYIYQYGFLFQDMGTASAMSVVTLFILLVVSLVQMRVFRSEVAD